MKIKISLKKDNRGSALIVAVAISLAAMVLALSLLLLSHSVFYAASRENSRTRCKEMAFSVSQELQNEITTYYKDYEEQKLALARGENPLWFYVRYHIWQEDGDWPYFNESEAQQEKEASFQYFKMESEGKELDRFADRILVTMYWDGSAEMQKKGLKEGTTLHIRVEVFQGEEYFANQMAFSLTVSEYGEVPEGTKDENGGLSIDAAERWKWVKE